MLGTARNVGDALQTDNEAVYDFVWVPDEGRWITVDCSAADTGNSAGYSGARLAPVGDWAERHRYEDGEWRAFATYPVGPQNNVRILDFFYMMEQIKPGGWLSPDPTQNP